MPKLTESNSHGARVTHRLPYTKDQDIISDTIMGIDDGLVGNATQPHCDAARQV